MITKLSAKNYKSLRDTELELHQFNVLIGPNAAGKSNIIDAIAFLSELTALDSVRLLFDPRGGFEKVAFGGQEKEIRLSLELPIDKLLHSYVIAFTEDHITRESLKVAEEVRMERAEGGHVDGEGGAIGLSADYSALRWVGHISRPEVWPSTHYLYRFLSSVRFYHITPSAIRSALPVKGTIDLAKTGENLAQVLHTLHNDHEEVFARIESLVRQALPEIERVRTPLVGGGSHTYVALREESGLEADFHQLSDGTLKLLAFITAISLPEPRLICFEEPENFTHARLQKFLVEAMKNCGKQIILSTHHPYFVDFVDPEDIIIVEKEKGETKASRVPSPKKLKRRLKELELNLGEYYSSGALGGTPWTE